MEVNSGFSYIGHTADAGLIAWGNSPAEVFRQAALGLLNMMLELETIKITDRKEIVISENGYEELLVHWLTEVKDAVEWRDFAVKDVQISNLTDKSLTANLLGEPLLIEKHIIAGEVKRVTRHDLRVWIDNDGLWKSRVIFDI